MKVVIVVPFEDKVDLNTLAMVTAIEEKAAECRKALIKYLVTPSVSPKPASLEIVVGD